MNITTYVDHIVTVFVEEMKDNVVGVYLHGSLAMGCFNPATSDVDMLVVCEESLSIETKRKFIKRLLALTKDSRNQLEMSIVLKKYTQDFVYPTPFELHYFHPTYVKDENYICGGDGFLDPDLAGHFVITYHRGVTLYGEKIKDVFNPIDRQYYIDSIWNDVKEAPKEIMENPVYFTLNLCRVLYYLKEGEISSKKEGGEWGARNLPHPYQEIVNQCLEVYIGTKKETIIPNDELVEFAKWMLTQCEQFK